MIIETSGPYVAFGFNSVKRDIVHLGGFDTLDEAKTAVKSATYHHAGIAKVTHPQGIWFYKYPSKFTAVDKGLIFDIITLLGV